MRKSAFAICDDHNAYIGYTSGRLWNGWATPYFTLEEAQKLQADWNKNAESPMLYDVNKDEFRLKYDGDDEPYIWQGEDIETVDGIKHLYGIGAYSHIWDELDEHIKKDRVEQICGAFEWEDEQVEARDVYRQIADLNTLVKAYGIIYDDNIRNEEIIKQLKELLNI
jgi:hypothetical protein